MFFDQLMVALQTPQRPVRELLQDAARRMLDASGGKEGLLIRSGMTGANVCLAGPCIVDAQNLSAPSVTRVEDPANRRGVNLPPIPATPATTRYFALLIGNNDYRYLKRLQTAVNDSQEVNRVLKSQFGFETELLLDATRDQIVDALNRYRRNLSGDDAFLIYYAGHGVFDKDVKKAYWLPVDAQEANTKWISADEITTGLRGIRSRQILVVSDSCYSGALSRDIPIQPLPSGDRARFLENLRARGPSRILLASGGNEPVADTGGGGLHSVFASSLLRGLQHMSFPQFTVEELFTNYIRESVAGQSGQVPECNMLPNSGHEGGSFIFERRVAGQ